MSDKPEMLDVSGTQIAVRRRPGGNPGLVWLGGYRSDMLGTKAERLDALAGELGLAYTRHDYSGHGESGGRFRDGTISRWTEESLAVFDLLKKPDLSPYEIKRIKAVAEELLETLKAEKLRVDHWRDKEATRDAVRQAIHDYLWSEDTGLPVSQYSDEDVQLRADDVYRHIFRAYPVVPSPIYGAQAAA